MRIIKKTNRVAAFCIAGLFFLTGCHPATGPAIGKAVTLANTVFTVAAGAQKIQAANLDIKKSKLEIQALERNGETFIQFESLSDEDLQKILKEKKVSLELKDGSVVTLSVEVNSPTSDRQSSPSATGRVVGNDPTKPLKNVRVGTNTDEAVLFELPVGSKVEIIGRARNADNFLWYEIYSPDKEAKGWIAHHLIELDDRSYSTKPSYPSPNTLTGRVVGDDPTQPLKNVRVGTNTNEPVLFELPVGSKVEITGRAKNADNFLWYEIYSPDKKAKGWIAHHLVEIE